MPDQPHHFSKLAEDLVGELRGVVSPPPPSHTIGGRRARQKIRATQALAVSIEQILQAHRIGREAPEHTIRDKWVELVGGALAADSHPVIIDRNWLLVIVRSSVVRQEFFHYHDVIVARIQKLPGCAHVKRLNFRPG